MLNYIQYLDIQHLTVIRERKNPLYKSLAAFKNVTRVHSLSITRLNRVMERDKSFRTRERVHPSDIFERSLNHI